MTNLRDFVYASNPFVQKQVQNALASELKTFDEIEEEIDLENCKINEISFMDEIIEPDV